MISIITVVYNNRDGLKKTLKSLKKLQSDKFEHVLTGIDCERCHGTC